MKRKVLSLLLTLALCLSLVPLTAVPVHADSHTHEGWTAWNTANALPTEAGNYYLTTDVTVTGAQHNAWSAPAGTTSICLEGHTIKYAGSTNGNVMRVYSGSTLHIYDKDDNSGKITGGAATWYYNGFDHFGNGGGVFVDGGTFYLHGGQITGNGAVAGGGVSVMHDGYFYMSGGIISDNTADDTNWFRAAGVQVESGSTFTMTGGTITANHGDYNARRWGVFVNPEGTINISGSPVITGNQGEYNLLLADGIKVNVIDSLSEDARIGVCTWSRVSEMENNPTVITSGLSGRGDLSNFVCNNDALYRDPPAYNSIRLAGGEAEVYYTAPHDVTITPGANMTKTTGSGAASQTGLTGAMTDVVYTADEGYYFPTDYAVASVDGISVTRNSEKQITVSGTPVTDVAIALLPPTAGYLYDLYIGEVQVTSNNAGDITSAINAAGGTASGTASYDNTSNTLTLNGFSFNGTGYGENISGLDITGEKHGAIFSKLDELTISLTGTNDITEAGGAYLSCGIFSAGAVSLEGSGNLTVSCGSSSKNVANEPAACGVYATDLTIDVPGGTVSINGAATTKKGHSYGLYVRNTFTVNDGTVSVIGGMNPVNQNSNRSYGASCATTIINDGTVTITAGSGYNSYGFQGGSLKVCGGELTVLVSDAYYQQRALLISKASCEFGSGMDAVVSNNADGSNPIPFADGDNNTVKYLKVAPLPTYNVTITAGANMTKTTDSGTASQTGLTGAMTDVVYTADEGYCFPTDYAVVSVNGISVTRNSYTQITVSGTPTADTEISLDAATAKTKLPTPSAVFEMNGDSDLDISGLVDGTTYHVGFPDGGAADFTVSGSKLTLSGIVAGNYSIKALAAGSAANEHIDSDAVQVTITEAASPAGVDKTDCTTTANNDGTIIGVDSTMEYQKSGDTFWTAVTGTSVTGLVPGTYSVRIASAGTALASDAVSVTIAEYTPPKADAPTFTPASGATFTESLDVTIIIPAGATVYYTDDGSDPSATNGTVTTGAAITLTDTTTLKAIVVMAGYDDSEVATATYTKTTPSSPSSGGGGGTATPDTYEVKPVTAENGKITVSPKNAAEGDKVTITVTPDEGYEFDKLTVKDKDGNEIKAKDNGDGTFIIEMPASEIEVEATFKEAEETPGSDDGFPFVDVPEDAYYRKPVEWAVENDITSGVSEDKYGPELSCTRAQVVTFLWITCGSEDAGTETGFDDVDVDAYYDKAVAWAVEQGITAGTSENEFSPEMTITRAQFVTMLWAAKGKPEPDGDMPFTDVPEDAYYAKAVAWAYANDITAGKSADSFAPDDPCTRGQIMTFLYNAYAE